MRMRYIYDQQLNKTRHLFSKLKNLKNAVTFL